MAAGRCVDTFVISLIADLDCHLMISAATLDENNLASGGDEQEYLITPGNEQPIIFGFEYYLGTGFNAAHADFGFHYDIDALNTGNALYTSHSPGLFNPPSPVTTGAANLLKTGDLTFVFTSVATIQFGADHANSQNVGGEIILNTGVTEP